MFWTPGTASAEDIDVAMQLGASHPMGAPAPWRSDRFGYLPGDHGSALQRDKGREVCTPASSQEDGGGEEARQKDRRWFL